MTMVSFKLVSHKGMMSYLKIELCASRRERLSKWISATNINVPVTKREETVIETWPGLSFNV